MHVLQGDLRIVLLGMIQSCFEAAMYIFVFMWTPKLEPLFTPLPQGQVPVPPQASSSSDTCTFPPPQIPASISSLEPRSRNLKGLYFAFFVLFVLCFALMSFVFCFSFLVSFVNARLQVFGCFMACTMIGSLLVSSSSPASILTPHPSPLTPKP